MVNIDKLSEELEIDTRSEEVRDFISSIPGSLIRWGTTVIFGVIGAVVAATYLIYYPDIVQAPFVLTTLDAPKAIAPKTDGRLVRLWVQDKGKVQINETLAWLESTTRHEEALLLEQELKALFSAVQQQNWQKIIQFDPLQYHHLGELQPGFQRFVQSHLQLQSILDHGVYLKRRQLLTADLEDLKQLRQNMVEQQALQQQDAGLARKELDIQRKLLEDKVIAPLDYRREESRYLAKLLPLKQTQTALVQNHTAQSAKQRELIDLDKTITEQAVLFLQDLNALQTGIDAWKQKSVIISPLSGTVMFQTDLQERQLVAANQELFVIGSSASATYTGLVRLPQANLGKIKVGQRVLIKFVGYPFHEFGFVPGSIAHISEVPDRDGTFLAKILLPEGLTTNYGKTIRYRHGMAASAEVVTENTRLIEKILYSIRRLLVRN